MFWGWGTKSKQWDLGDGRILMLSWSYFSLLFCPVSSNTQWFILSDSRSQDRRIGYGEVQALIPENTPTMSLWSRFGLWIVGGAYVIIATVAALTLPAT